MVVFSENSYYGEILIPCLWYAVKANITLIINIDIEIKNVLFLYFQ